MQIPAVSSYAADRAARLARLVGGAIVHRHREALRQVPRRSLAVRLRRDRHRHDAGTTDFMVHGDEFAQGYVREGDLPFARLLFRLSMRKMPGARAARPRGSRRAATSRSRTASPTASFATCGAIASRRTPGLFNPRSTSAFDDHARDRGYMWIRARNLPERILAAVPRHARHRRVQARPARTRRSRSATSIRSISRRASRCSPPRRSTCSGPAIASTCCRARSRCSDIGDLTRVDLELDKPRDPARARRRCRRADRRRAPARGGDGPAAPRGRDADPARARARGSSASCSRCRRSSLRGHRVAVTERGILVVGIGEPRRDPARPAAVRADAGPARAARHGRRAARVARSARARSRSRAPASSPCSRRMAGRSRSPESAFTSLERRSLAKLDGRARRPSTISPPSRSAEAQVVNDAVGRFALWGFPDAPDRKLLPPGDEVSMAQAHVREFLERFVRAARLRRRAPRRRADPDRGSSSAGTPSSATRRVELVAVDDARATVLSTLVVRAARVRARGRRARTRRGPPQRAVPRAPARRAVVGQRPPAPPHHRHRARAGQPAVDARTARA